jgi:hypothetical protein
MIVKNSHKNSFLDKRKTFKKRSGEMKKHRLKINPQIKKRLENHI